MKSILVAASLSLALAFRPVSHRQPFRRAGVALEGTKQDPQSIDWARAKHCAEHFGSCEVAEVEELYASKFHIVCALEVALPK